jgi:hypothetical protein
VLVAKLALKLEDVFLQQAANGGAFRKPERQAGAYILIVVEELKLFAKAAARRGEMDKATSCAVEPAGSCLMEPSGRWIWIWLVESDMVVIKDR